MQEAQEMQVQSLDQEDRLEEEMATHFSILAWEIPWTEELAGYSSCGRQSWTPLSNYTTTTTAPPCLTALAFYFLFIF